MDHSYYQERLSAYLDRELPAGEMEAMTEHLAGCDECLGRLEQLKSLDKFTEQHSTLDESDYWERSAQKIEARVAREAGKITDIKRAKGGLYAGLWWKLPAIAASIVIVGYIGLHESEIVRDGMLIPPTERREAPVQKPADDRSGYTDEARDAEQPVDRDIQAESKIESGEGAGAESGESRQDAGQTITRPSISEPEPVSGPQPESVPESDQVVRQTPSSPIIGAPKIDDLTDRYKAPAPQASSLGQAVPAGADDQETVVADEIATEKTLEEETNKIEVPPPPPGRAEEVLKSKISKVGRSGAKGSVESATSFADESSNLAERMVDQEELKSWRDRRDSLETLKNVLESGAGQSAAKTPKYSAVTKLRSGAAPTEAPPDTTKAALERLEVDLVEAWYRVCLLSDDPLEINRGTEYLKDIAFDQQSKSGERARRYLELLDR